MIGKKKESDDYGVIDNVSPSYTKKEVTCKYCKFSFKVNYATKTPRKCPYCSRPYFVEY